MVMGLHRQKVIASYMIDLHCHYLPGIDDGAANLAASLELARAAVASGITHTVCTPHIHFGYFNNDIDIISSTHTIFAAALARENIPLKTHYAAEIRITPEIIQLNANNRLPFLGYLNERPVLLVELPHSHIPPGTEQLLDWLNANGITPMIAHPERNRDILANYNKAGWLKGRKVLFQLTAGAIAGSFGEKIQDCAFAMLNDGFADIVATDAHNMHKRPPQLKEAFELLSNNYSEELATELCTTTPWEIAKQWFS